MQNSGFREKAVKKNAILPKIFFFKHLFDGTVMKFQL
jgi:hypothetical protein